MGSVQLLCTAIFSYCSVPLFGAVFAVRTPAVYTNEGYIVGQRVPLNGEEVDVFYGIPYAAPPLNELRFSKPQPARPWKGTYNATTKPNPCIQTDLTLNQAVPLNYSGSAEDCLYLNIWRPAKHCRESPKCKANLPVVVFIHGGGFQWGDSGLFVYDGSNFALTADVVFLTFNYRVGIFGFLSLGSSELPGNWGLWDQNLALKWVRANIASFGGDASRVTLWGQSAGAASAGFQALSPHSAGLFDQLVLQSGTPFLTIMTDSDSHVSRFLRLSAAVGCHNATQDWKAIISDITNCLRNVDARTLLRKVSEDTPKNQLFSPTYHGNFLVDGTLSEGARQKISARKIFIGQTTNEGTVVVHSLLNQLQQVKSVLHTDYRLVLTVTLAVMFNIPVTAAKHFIAIYYGDRDVQHNNNEVVSLMAEMLGDAIFGCPTKLFTEIATQQGIDVYRYEFAHRPTFSVWPKSLGVAHADDLSFMIGSLPFVKDVSKYTPAVSEKARESLRNTTEQPQEWDFMAQLLQMMSSFVKTGKPTIPLSNEEWPKYTAQNPEFVYLQPNNYTRGFGPKKDRCEYWRPYLMKKKEPTPTTTKTMPGGKPSGTWKPTAKNEDPRGNEISSSQAIGPSAVLCTILFCFRAVTRATIFSL